jgi:hypothetical protein
MMAGGGRGLPSRRAASNTGILPGTARITA